MHLKIKRSHLVVTNFDDIPRKLAESIFRVDCNASWDAASHVWCHAHSSTEISRATEEQKA